jgi:NDP-sugar pyrophosphorylase family protein
LHIETKGARIILKKFSFSENYLDLLPKDLLKLLNNPMYSDIIFHVEDQTVYAHSIILIARSETFRNFFLHNKVTHPIQVTQNSIQISSAVTYKSLMYLLEMIYSNEIWAQPLQRQ